MSVRPIPHRGESEPAFRRITITPAMARKMLEGNTRNRNVRESKVKAYAADMIAGKFNGLNGETIKVAADGTILDGQHRLLAIVLSNIPLEAYLVTNLQHSAQDGVDIGMKRTFGDQLKIHGFKNHNELAALIRLTWLWDSGTRTSVGGKSATVTPSQLWETLSRHPKLPDHVVRTGHVRGLMVRPSVFGLASYLFATIDANDAEYFLGRLVDGQELIVGDAIYALRRALTPAKNKRGLMQGDSSWWSLALMIKAWNAYRANQEVMHLRFRLGHDEFPTPR